MPKIENDKKKKTKTTQHLQELCVCLFGVKEGWRGNYILSSFVVLCSSASVILNLYADKRKKITYQYERENNR